MFTNSRHSRRLPLLAMGVASLLVVGCEDAGELAATNSINTRVTSLADAAYDGQVFAASFIDGAVPDNRGDYARMKIEVAGEPTVSGQGAKVPVKLIPLGGEISPEGGMSAATGELPQEIVQTSWSLKKVGEEWKIAKAPLN